MDAHEYVWKVCFPLRGTNKYIINQIDSNRSTLIVKWTHSGNWFSNCDRNPDKKMDLWC